MALLLQQDFTKCPNAILDLCGFSKDAISISNKTDLAVLLMQNNESILFEDINHYFNLTKDQLNNLGNELPKLWSNESFLFKYMEKLFPTQISFYLNTYFNTNIEIRDNFQNQLPKDLAMNCYDMLLHFAMKHDKAKLIPIRKANILLNWMIFRCNKYVCFSLFMYSLYFDDI